MSVKSQWKLRSIDRDGITLRALPGELEDFLRWVEHEGMEHELEEFLAFPPNIDRLNLGIAFRSMRVKFRGSPEHQERKVDLDVIEIFDEGPYLRKGEVFIGHGPTWADATINCLLTIWELGLYRRNPDDEDE
jgi:hypothetical protein